MSLVMTGQDQYVCVVMFSFVYFNPEVPKQTAALEHDFRANMLNYTFTAVLCVHKAHMRSYEYEVL